MLALLFFSFVQFSQNCEFMKRIESVAVTPDDLLRPFNYPVIIYDKVPTVAPGYLIVHKNIRDSMKKMRLHAKQQGWRRNSLICVISPILDKQLFETMYDFGVPNVVMETPNGSFIYNPFHENILKLEENTKRQFDKIWKDLNGKNVLISVFNHALGFPDERLGSGLDGSFLYELSKWMNFTPVLKDSKDMDYMNLQLKSNEVDLGGIGHFIKYYDEKFEMTGVVYRDEVCVVLHSAKILRGWDIFLRAFQWQVWALICSTALITNFILTIMCPHWSYSSWLPLTLRAMFMIPLRRLPKGIKDRYIIGGCILFGVVIVTTYQASLYHFIHARTHYKEPESIKDVKLKIVKTEVTDEFLKIYGIRARRKEVELLVQTGFITSDIHIVPRCLEAYSIGYPVPYGSPYLRHISKFAIKVFEAGLPQAWYRLTVFHKRKPRKNMAKNSVRVLNISDFEVAFFSLIMGLTVSSAVFAIEIMSKFASRHWIKNQLEPIRPFER